jgi:Pyridoxamine 5'-phosphate oxidase
MTTAQQEHVAAILAANADMAIATIRPDGFPQTTIVSYASEGDRVFFGCSARSQKARSIALCDRVSFAVHNNVRDWDKILGVSVGGRAIRLTATADMTKLAALMLRKFPQIGDFLTGDGSDMALFRIDPIAISLLDYTQGFGHCESVAPMRSD